MRLRGAEPNERADRFAALLADHHVALQEFTALARAVPADTWDLPRASGKWSPAQEAKHLSLGYCAFVRDLQSEGTMRLRGRWWQRLLWRRFALPSVLGGRIPRAAPAPREVRPPEHPGDQAALIAELIANVERFERVAAETHRREPARRVTHPYFNRLTLHELLRFGAVHMRHHAEFVRLAVGIPILEAATPPTTPASPA